MMEELDARDSNLSLYSSPNILLLKIREPTKVDTKKLIVFTMPGTSLSNWVYLISSKVQPIYGVRACPTLVSYTSKN